MDYGPDPGVAPWVRSCCRRRGLILPERAVLADGSPPSRRASGPVAQWERSSFTPSRLGVRVPPGSRRMPAETLTPLGQNAASSSDARGASPRARASYGRSRRSPQHVSVAQWRAHLVPNQGVAGSSPAGDTHNERDENRRVTECLCGAVESAPDYESGGRGFESLQGHQHYKILRESFCAAS